MVELWACHVAVKDLFQAVATQWRMGPRGPVGLDYAGVREVMRFRCIPRADWAELFDDLQVMEVAALELIHKDLK